MRSAGGSNSSAPANSTGTPIVAIEHAVPVDDMVAVVRGLPEAELEQLYAFLPDDTAAVPRTRESLISVLRSYQFREAVSTLDHVLLEAPVGGVVAAELGYDYAGEGVEGFLRGARSAGIQQNKNKRQNTNTNNDDTMNDD